MTTLTCEKTPKQVMREVTEDMILRAIKLAKKRGRTIYISKSAKGKGVDVSTLDPRTPEGIKNLDAFFSTINRVYTFSGLGAPEEPNAINWRLISLPSWRRTLVLVQVGVSFLMKGTPLKRISSIVGWGARLAKTLRSCKWHGLITSGRSLSSSVTIH